DLSIDDSLSGIFGNMWSDQPEEVAELLKVIAEVVRPGSTGKRPSSKRVRDAFAVISTLVGGQAERVPEDAVRQAMQLLETFEQDDQLRQVAEDLRRYVGPEINPPH